jgi:hypothetical protein
MGALMVVNTPPLYASSSFCVPNFNPSIASMIDFGFCDDDAGAMPSPVDPSEGISTIPSFDPTAMRPYKKQLENNSSIFL